MSSYIHLEWCLNCGLFGTIFIVISAKGVHSWKNAQSWFCTKLCMFFVTLLSSCFNRSIFISTICLKFVICDVAAEKRRSGKWPLSFIEQIFHFFLISYLLLTVLMKIGFSFSQSWGEKCNRFERFVRKNRK